GPVAAEPVAILPVLERRASEYRRPDGPDRPMLTAAELLAVLLIVGANGFFVAAEYALVTVRRTRMQELIDQGSRRARRVLELLSNPARFISAIQLGVTLSSLALGAIGEPVLSSVLERPLDLLPSSWRGGATLTVAT